MKTNYLERDIERALVNKVKSLGGIAYKWVSPGRVGVCDRIVLMPNSKIVFVELKSSVGKCTVRQLREHEIIRGFGFEVRVINSLEQVNAFTR